MSIKTIDEFKSDFGCDVRLNGALYSSDGDYTYFKYSCDTKSLKKFRTYVKSWLKEHFFPGNTMFLEDCIKLYSDGELSDKKISDFEEEFGVVCKGYSISCNSKIIEYKFEFVNKYS